MEESDSVPKVKLSLKGYYEVDLPVHHSLRDLFQRDKLSTPPGVSSEVWQMFRKKELISDRESKCWCLYCGQGLTTSATGTTTHLLAHLKTHVHSLTSVSKMRKRPTEDDLPQKSSPAKRIQQDDVSASTFFLPRLTPERALAEMITGLLLPFDLVNQPLFKAFVTSLGYTKKVTAYKVQQERMKILSETEAAVRLLFICCDLVLRAI